MRRRATLVVALPIAVLAACSTPGASSGATNSAGIDLLVFGAASLGSALERAEARYETAHPGTTVTIVTDSSAALATQIEQGAPADVFLSADTTHPMKLVDQGLVDGDAVPFAGNTLTIVIPADNPAGIETPADLARAGVKVIAARDEVPITTYASQLVANLARQPGAPAGYAAAYAANIVSREDNVQAILARIELGEGDAGIVYVTDARTSTRVATVGVPDAVNVQASYAGVVVKTATDRSAARAFLTWLVGPEGTSILGEFGFLPPP